LTYHHTLLKLAGLSLNKVWIVANKGQRPTPRAVTNKDLAKRRSGVVTAHCMMTKINKTGMSPGEIVLIGLDLGLTEKPEPGFALGFEPVKAGRAEFRCWAREKEKTPEDHLSRFKLKPGGVILLGRAVCMSTASR